MSGTSAMMSVGSRASSLRTPGRAFIDSLGSFLGHSRKHPRDRSDAIMDPSGYVDGRSKDHQGHSSICPRTPSTDPSIQVEGSHGIIDHATWNPSDQYEGSGEASLDPCASRSMDDRR